MLLAAAGGASFVSAVISLTGSVTFVLAGVLVIQQLVSRARRSRLLWHVRRKLTTSYVFIGFVPALLIIAFFTLGGLLIFFNISSYLMESRMRALEDQGQFLAQAAALEIQRVTNSGDAAAALGHRQEITVRRYPGASYAVVPTKRTCPGPEGPAGPGPAMTAPLSAGPWDHLDPPTELPQWVACTGHAGLVAYDEPADAAAAPPNRRTHIAVRSTAFPDGRAPGYAVIVDIPVGAEIEQQLRGDTGIEFGAVTAITTDQQSVRPMTVPVRRRAVATGPAAASVPPVSAQVPRGLLERPLNWFSVLDFVDWPTGKRSTLAIAIGMSPAEIYRRISATPVQVGNYSLGQILLLFLTFVGGLFLVIEAIAFVMGLSLARSITGSVHELFVGTGKIRAGDFTYKIPIRTHDQLGDLAESFNSMTTSIEELLEQKAEKERLAQELRIARDIQMSLLPQGDVQMPGLALSGYCEPAREVGGDYYDLLRLDEHRLAVLIADVSGKGTSAALYMAELKGVMLSLSQQHRSPRALLVAANRIVSQHLDTRSFITMTYGIVDMRARTFTFARAGHCPLLYLPWSQDGAATTRVVAPGGMVLGLTLDRDGLFERMLHEETIPLGAGDLVVLFTDGISEAMNEAGECFGEGRLGNILESQRDRPFPELRERIIRDVRAFVGDQGAHDDMTMLLLKVEAMAA